tara:strand:+ start:550 stop:744 length:195 start_codon:yes stop_codon:yes gene_type:complete
LKVGDMVKHRIPTALGYAEDEDTGVVVEILNATDAKAWKKVRVLTEKGLEDWIIQFCEVVNESR